MSENYWEFDPAWPFDPAKFGFAVTRSDACFILKARKEIAGDRKSRVIKTFEIRRISEKQYTLLIMDYLSGIKTDITYHIPNEEVVRAILEHHKAWSPDEPDACRTEPDRVYYPEDIRNGDSDYEWEEYMNMNNQTP